MSDNRTGKIAFMALFVAFLAVFGVMAISFSTAQADIPGPLAAPTPVSINPASAAAVPATFLQTRVVTADLNSAVQNIQNGGKMDLQWVFDQTVVAAAANTTTLKLQFSNDGVNWVDGASFVAANSADVNDMNQFAIFGRYARVNVDVSNSNPVTITAIGLAK